jgi:LytS/YehU family sensor histidine kinase
LHLLSQFLAHGTVRAFASLAIEILLIRVERIREELEMKMTFLNKQAVALMLSVVLLIGAFGTLNVNAQRRSRDYYRGPHHSRAKGALIGAGVGLIGGALIGGKRGALIGTGAGAGTGYLIQRHRNNRGRYRRYYRRY